MHINDNSPAVSEPLLDAIPVARLVLTGGNGLPDGVMLRSLTTHFDSRGDLTELFRDDWAVGPHPLQWNMVRSRANVLRGVHVHRHHIDYLTIALGEMVLGLHDLRATSPTYRLSSLLRLKADDQHLVVIPVGVAHGFYFPAPASVFYSVTQGFDGSDEFGCRWDDPALRLDWPCRDPLLSARDVSAGSYAGMIAGAGLQE